MKHIFILLMLALPLACTKKKPAEPPSLFEQGRTVYNRHCIACHNVDITKDGSIGPAVAGSSLELLDLRVLKAEYPAGYTPKRQTRTMVPLPFLKSEIPALHAYLNPQ